jgi:hypothetical protein
MQIVTKVRVRCGNKCLAHRKKNKRMPHEKTIVLKTRFFVAAITPEMRMREKNRALLIYYSLQAIVPF